MVRVLLMLTALLAPASSPVRGQDVSAKTPDYSRGNFELVREPAYSAEPLYAVFLFGPAGGARVCAALDKSAGDYYDVLYFDLNANRDLTDEGERFQGFHDDERLEDARMVIGVGDFRVPGTNVVHRDLWFATGPETDEVRFGMRWRGKSEITGGYSAGGTKTTKWSHSLESAPVLHPTAEGPHTFALGSREEEVQLDIGSDNDIFLLIGTPGSGPDTFCALDEHFLDLEKDVLRVTLTAIGEDGREVKASTRITEHC